MNDKVVIGTVETEPYINNICMLPFVQHAWRPNTKTKWAKLTANVRCHFALCPSRSPVMRF